MSLPNTAGHPPIAAKADSLSLSSSSTPGLAALMPASVPPQVAIEHPSGNEPELDLAGSLHDGELFGVPVPLLGGVVGHVPRGSEELHGETRCPHRELGGVVLGRR